MRPEAGPCLLSRWRKPRSAGGAGKRRLEFLAQRFLALLALDETLALGEGERIVVRHHRFTAAGTSAERLLDTPGWHGPVLTCHRLDLGFRELPLVLLCRSGFVLPVDVADSAVVVNLSVRLEHALVFPLQSVLHLRLR